MKIEVYIYIYILFVEITYIIHFFINLNTNGSTVEWSDYLTLRLWSVAVLKLVFLLISHYDPTWETLGMTRALKAHSPQSWNWLLGLLVLGLLLHSHAQNWATFLKRENGAKWATRSIGKMV